VVVPRLLMRFNVSTLPQPALRRIWRIPNGAPPRWRYIGQTILLPPDQVTIIARQWLVQVMAVAGLDGNGLFLMGRDQDNNSAVALQRPTSSWSTG